MGFLGSLLPLLESEEEVLWAGQPDAFFFFAPGIVGLALAAAWAFADRAWLGFFFDSLLPQGGMPHQLRTAFAALHMGLPGLFTLRFLFSRFLLYRATGYAVTSRRVFFREGGGWHFLAGSRIVALDVVARPFEALAHLGTVRCFDGTRSPCGRPTFHALCGMASPYEVYDRIESISPHAKGILGLHGLWRGAVLRPESSVEERAERRRA